MLREAGATEVHLAISSPPWVWPCFYGIDTPTRDGLLAAQVEPSQIAAHLDADSVTYLSLDGLKDAIGVGDPGFCTACLTGDYPTSVPIMLSVGAGSGE
jgi:amidophosphoribosyltransferase